MAKVYHSEIFGLRETKYDWLNKHDIKKIKWKKIVPHPEFYQFIPTDDKLANHYFSFDKITEIFPVNSVGIVTARDSLTIGWDMDEIWRRVNNFVNLDPEIARLTYLLGKDVRDWKVELAQKDIKDSGLKKTNITLILYRPFDLRFTYYTGNSRGFHCMPRGDVMLQLMEENMALCVGRQSSVIGSERYNIVFLSERIVDLNLFRRGGELVFPLYIYKKVPTKKKVPLSQLMLFEPEVEYEAILPNISKTVIEMLVDNYDEYFLNPTETDKKGQGFGSKEIFYYCYAILYSNTYRTKYAEFLKIDFPRIPFTKDYKLFIQLGKLGKQLADLHLLKSKELEKTISKFPIDGSNEVEKPIFKVETHRDASLQSGKVFINQAQYFDGVTKEVWNYQIGGYQVCEKWLKDRKGRTLSTEEIKTYCKIVTSLSKTIELQNEIDKYFDYVEKTV